MDAAEHTEDPPGLEATTPAARTLVAEWHESRNGRIVRARSAFDGRPFAATFASAGQ